MKSYYTDFYNREQYQDHQDQGGSTTTVTATWRYRDRRPNERMRVSCVLMYVGIVPDKAGLGILMLFSNISIQTGINFA